MTKKTLSRAEIGEMLRPWPGQAADELTKRTLEGLEDALQGIASASVPSGYTIDSAAAAIGHLLAGCTEQAARAARQVGEPLRAAAGIATGDPGRAS